MKSIGPDGPSSFAETCDFLFNLRNRGSKFGMDRIVKFAETAGNPEKSFPSIHVAGTNGKGSVCALLESALRAGGYQTGLYTSPHLIHLGERVQVDREPLSEERIVEETARLRRFAAKDFEEASEEYPSFFEFMTLMAFSRFAGIPVDCALVEVGLGGRLDATNILLPEVSVITSIGLDHTEILGDTIEKIAAEKAGIIKADVPVVIGFLPPTARDVVIQRANGLSGPVYLVEDRFPEKEFPETNLVGDYQRRNAATAWLTLEVVRSRFPIPDKIIQDAFLRVNWSGRWEQRMVGGRTVIFDSTHNPEGAAELQKNLLAQFGEPKGDREVVVGSLGEARAHAVLQVVAPYVRRLHLVRPAQPKALSFAECRRLVPENFSGEVLEARVEELFPGGDRCLLADDGTTALVTGSIYLLGEIFSRLQEGDSSETGRLQDRF